MGLTNYCSRYIPNYSSITYPLRQLTKADTKFRWTDEHEKAFITLKQALTSAPVLAHYSLEAKTRVVVDASPWAVGAVLLQEQQDNSYRPVAYGSRSLSETEQKYAQIEKESLAIVFGCEHFHMYLYGREFELETDHRPLEHICKPKPNNASKPTSARIERWRLRLQEYDFKVVYRPGPKNLADPLSRLPKQSSNDIRSNMKACADRYVHYLSQYLAPRAMSIEEIQQASINDSELALIRSCLQTNELYKIPKPYQSVVDELCTTNQEILLRGNRIVLQTKLRKRAIFLAHEDHAGITKCKQRIRTKLWWPQIDKQIEEHVKCCHPCQLVAQPPRPEPMHPTKLPKEPWTELAIDICGPFPTGEYIVVLTDYYSRCPEAKILKNVTSATILKWLNSIFAQHGYPQVLKSDNASYFTSTLFKATLQSWGVQHHTVTENWPQANGQVERFNEVIKKHVLTAQAEQKDWRESLPNLLLHYRTTPHRITGQTPAKLLMNREIRTTIPNISTADEPTDLDMKVRKKDENEKSKAKVYTDKKRHAAERQMIVGDKVLVKQKRKNKYSTKFYKDPMTITKINGTQIVLTDRHGKQH